MTMLQSNLIIRDVFFILALVPGQIYLAIARFQPPRMLRVEKCHTFGVRWCSTKMCVYLLWVCHSFMNVEHIRPVYCSACLCFGQKTFQATEVLQIWRSRRYIRYWSILGWTVDLNRQQTQMGISSRFIGDPGTHGKSSMCVLTQQAIQSVTNSS